MFCTYCGKQMPEKATFCTHCGKPRVLAPNPNPAVNSTDASQVCPSCAKPLVPNLSFCEYCGARIQAARPVSPATGAPVVENQLLRISPASYTDVLWIALRFTICFLAIYFSFAHFGSWDLAYMADDGIENNVHTLILIIGFILFVFLGLLFQGLNKSRLFSVIGGVMLLVSFIVFLVNFAPSILTNQPGGYTNGNQTLIYISAAAATASLVFFVASFRIPHSLTLLSAALGALFYFALAYGVSSLVGILTERFLLWHAGYVALARILLGVILIVVMFARDKAHRYREVLTPSLYKHTLILGALFFAVYLVANSLGL